MPKSRACRPILVTFGDGQGDMKLAAERLVMQALQTRLFSIAVATNATSLIQASRDFKEIFPELLELDAAPLHFRAVKPWLVQSAMRGAFGRAHCVVYMDAGCELLDTPIARIRLRSRLGKACLCGGFSEKTRLLEAEWSKKYLLDELDVSIDERRDFQFQATWFALRVDESNFQLVDSWRLLSHPGLNLWQNPSTNLEAGPDLREHRRDQSLFSVLYRRSKLPHAHVAMDFELESRLGRVRSFTMPVLTIRNRFGKSRLSKPTWAQIFMGALVYPMGQILWSLSNFKSKHLARAKLESEMKESPKS